MTPIKFPEANTLFKAPSDMDESQVATIPAWTGQVRGGSCDGVPLVVVAWRPTEADLIALRSGEPVYLSMFGGLAPHFLTTNFQQAINVA